MNLARRIPKLFMEDPTACQGYRCGLLPHAQAQREIAERMWQRYVPLADSNFLTSIRVDFHPRFWEMYLAVALMDAGLEVMKAGDAGPEFFVMSGQRRVWFEAIAPEAGTGQDAVKRWEPGQAGSVPIDSVVLRYTSAVRTKKYHLDQGLRAGRIKSDDCYVISLNAASVPHAIFGTRPSYGSRSLYGIGDLTLLLDTATDRVVDQFHVARQFVSKQNGSAVSVSPFLSEEYSACSAALISTVAFWNLSPVAGSDFEVYHNPLASNPVDPEILSSFDQFTWAYSADGGVLSRISSAKTT